MPTNGFTFANPTYTADNFYAYSAGDLAGDSKLQAEAVLEKIPAPRINPPVFDLTSILGTDAVAQIEASGKLVFHSVGDTGGIVRAEPQLAVADALAADLAGRTYANGLPAFFFHLGDVVYYFGQEQYYPEQFYDPYRTSPDRDISGPLLRTQCFADHVVDDGDRNRSAFGRAYSQRGSDSRIVDRLQHGKRG